MSEDYEVEVHYGAGPLKRLEPVPPPRPEMPDEFDRFEELTRKLVNVPKTEIDEKRKAES